MASHVFFNGSVDGGSCSAGVWYHGTVKPKNRPAVNHTSRVASNRGTPGYSAVKLSTLHNHSTP